MQQFALGRLGVSVDEFYSMTVRELHNAQVGFYENQNFMIQENLAAARIICYHILKPHLKKNQKLKITDVFELPMDVKARKERLKKLKPIKLERNDK